jgi:integrase
MASLYRKRGTWWARYQDEQGKWKGCPTGIAEAERSQADRWLAAFVRELGRGRDDDGVITVRRFLERWIKERRGLGLVTAGNDEQRLLDHAAPLHDIPIADVRPRHIRELIIGLRTSGKFAPRTIRHVYGTLATMFRSAVAQEVIAATPCVLERGVLPKKVDKDPEWRATAIFSRGEIESIISDERILADRRVVYALKALAALRHAEAATLRWSQYDPRAEPLGSIALGKTKTSVPRLIPVHPTLARILAEWRLSGWESTFGRRPRPDDLIVPTRLGTVRQSPDTQHTFLEDLERIGLRGRRGHDLRRSFITLARVDGAGPALEVVTHGPRGSIVDLYTTWPWPTLCAAVRCLRVELLGGAVFTLPCDQRATRLSAKRNQTGKLATPEGFEPSLPT